MCVDDPASHSLQRLRSPQDLQVHQGGSEGHDLTWQAWLQWRSVGLLHLWRRQLQQHPPSASGADCDCCAVSLTYRSSAVSMEMRWNDGCCRLRLGEQQAAAAERQQQQQQQRVSGGQ